MRIIVRTIKQRIPYIQNESIRRILSLNAYVDEFRYRSAGQTNGERSNRQIALVSHDNRRRIERTRILRRNGRVDVDSAFDIALFDRYLVAERFAFSFEVFEIVFADFRCRVVSRINDSRFCDENT